MKATQPKAKDELRMSAQEFDRIMGQALRVKPEPKKARRPAKRKAPGKKAKKG